jgi:Na+/proline symporter
MRAASAARIIKMAFDSFIIFIQVFIAGWLGILWSRHKKNLYLLMSGLFSALLSLGLDYFEFLKINNQVHESKLVYCLGSFIIGCFSAAFFGFIEKYTKK